jgi:hypothetical protein
MMQNLVLIPREEWKLTVGPTVSESKVLKRISEMLIGNGLVLSVNQYH